ncbi:hypothetical protein ScPMuIL_006342 [Solemya velum]
MLKEAEGRREKGGTEKRDLWVTYHKAKSLKVASSVRSNSTTTTGNSSSLTSNEAGLRDDFQILEREIHVHPGAITCTSSDSLSQSDSLGLSDFSITDASTSSDDPLTDISLSDSGGSVSTDVDTDSESGQKTGFKTYEHPLYPGCSHTQLSLYTSLIMCVNKHSMTKEAFSDILAIIASIDTSWGITKSVYKVKEILKTSVKLEKPSVHFFCENCQAELQTSADNCTCTVERRVLEFSNLNVEKQIQKLFTDERFCDAVMAERNYAEPGVLRDVCDGQEYKRLVLEMQDTQAIHLTFTMNTDGVAVFSSSKKGNLWPVYLAINELPVQLRFSKKYILPCYLHCQIEKPNMLTYLSNLMKTLASFSSEGLKVMTCFGKRTLKCHLLAACLDLPARALVANMKQFNGKFGCIFCFDEGQSDPAKPMQRFYPFSDKSQLRTHTSILQDIRIAVQNRQPERGIKGASALVALNYVNLAKVFPVDWMHCVLLGVTKALLNFWLGRTYRTENFYVGDKVALLNRRLLQIQVPDFVARRQRSLEEAQHWKASECREWLLHFSIPVLTGTLEQEALVHYSLLVSAMSLLAGDVVTFRDISFAEELLKDFCRVFPIIYGVQKQTMNLHLLRHLPECVMLYGPLFHFSCFGFESMNSHLKSMFHGSRHINSQITFAVAMTKSLPSLVKSIVAHTGCNTLRRLLKQLASKTSSDDTAGSDADGAIGRKTEVLPDVFFHDDMDEVLLENNLGRQVFCFHRYRCRNVTYTCKQYGRNTIRNNSIVVFQCDTGPCVGEIFLFLECDGSVFAVVNKFRKSAPAVAVTAAVTNRTLHKYCNKALCAHLQQVVEDGHCIIPVANIVKKCVLMKIDNILFSSVPPNLLEHS